MLSALLIGPFGAHESGQGLTSIGFLRQSWACAGQEGNMVLLAALNCRASSLFLRNIALEVSSWGWNQSKPLC